MLPVLGLVLTIWLGGSWTSERVSVYTRYWGGYPVDPILAISQPGLGFEPGTGAAGRWADVPLARHRDTAVTTEPAAEGLVVFRAAAGAKLALMVPQAGGASRLAIASGRYRLWRLGKELMPRRRRDGIYRPCSQSPGGWPKEMVPSDPR